MWVVRSTTSVGSIARVNANQRFAAAGRPYGGNCNIYRFNPINEGVIQMNRRQVKAALIVRVAVQVQKEMKNPHSAKRIVEKLGMKDSPTVRKKVVRAARELEERWG